MVEKIPSTELRLGMYIHKLGGSWIKHPFLRSSFLVQDETVKQRILKAGIKEVWIDRTKGVPDKQEQTVENVAPAVVETEAEVVEPVTKKQTPASMAAEVERARKLCEGAKEQVKSMFSEARLGKAIDPELTAALVNDIDSLVQSNSSAILSVARLKTHDDYTYMHSVAVCALMISLARQLNLSEEQVKCAGKGGLMHDLGKAFVPLEILNKPGKLTDAEFDTMKIHPGEGANALKAIGVKPEIVDIAMYHHEKVNGQGYPHGLKGDEIPLLARMGAICDVYDAVTSDRPYKRAWNPSSAIQTMAQWDGHFDKEIFAAFVKSVGIYPVGSLVRLSSKRLAVVVEPGADSLLKPKVKVFFSISSNAAIPVQIVDLAAPSSKVTIEGPENPEKWGFKSLDTFWQ